MKSKNAFSHKLYSPFQICSSLELAERSNILVQD